jgi:hypothetical protein
MNVEKYGFKVVARAPQTEEDRCDNFDSKMLMSNFIKECCALAGEHAHAFELVFEDVKESASPADMIWFWKLNIKDLEIKIEITGTADHSALYFRPEKPIRKHWDDDYTEQAMCGVSIENKKVKFRWNSQKNEIRDFFEIVFNRSKR